MGIFSLDVVQVRNLQRVSIEPSEGLNLFIGPNASGKTSLLESVYLLGLARSFRTTKPVTVIREGSDVLRVVGQVKNAENRVGTLGVERFRDGKLRIRVSGRDVKQRSALAEWLPIQLLDADIHRLVDLGPKVRRRFIDWGVFHVEHSYLETWATYNRCLVQRNHALREMASTRTLSAWDAQLAQAGEALTTRRQAYVKGFAAFGAEMARRLIGPSAEVDIRLRPGWRQDLSLLEQLRYDRARDLKMGFTHSGPQRADLDIGVNGRPAVQLLSRGEQKLLVYALRLAQVAYLRHAVDRQVAVLIDDIGAELDLERQGRVLGVVGELECQTFLTSLSEEILGRFPGASHYRLFHVEQGRVRSVMV